MIAAAVQFEPKLMKKEDNRKKIAVLIQKAADAGAKLIVFPELCFQGYNFSSRAELNEYAEEIPNGEDCLLLSEMAKYKDVTIVAGLAEKSGIL